MSEEMVKIGDRYFKIGAWYAPASGSGSPRKFLGTANLYEGAIRPGVWVENTDDTHESLTFPDWTRWVGEEQPPASS